MHVKSLSVAAFAAFALAGVAHAAGATKTDRSAMKAEKDKIEANYKADQARCKKLKANAKDVCQADAKGKEKVARAELTQKAEPSPAHQRKVDEARANHRYDVAKEKCGAQKGDAKRACEKQAKAERDRDRADIKQKYARAENGGRSAASGASAKAK